MLGINAGGVFWGEPSSDWNPQLASMQADGIQSVRADAFWWEAEPSAPGRGGASYSWSDFDTMMTDMAEHHITWLPIFDYAAPWSESVRGNQYSAPASNSDYAAYVAAFVKRYGPSGSFWIANPSIPYDPVTQVEIWNEENLSIFWDDPNPATYAATYEAARTAVHSVNPDVQVIVGGLTGGDNADAEFFESVISDAGGIANIDAVALHPYDSTAADVVTDIAVFRWWLDQIGGANLPLDITEFGWPTTGASDTTTMTYAQQGQALASVTANVANSYCDVEGLYPFAWWSSDENPADTGNWYGVVAANGQPTASSTALASEYQSLETGSIPANSSLCGSAL